MICPYSGLPYWCEYCPEDAAPCSYNNSYCEKLKKWCICKPECDPDKMKKLGCYESLKQQNLFENQ